jgi:hypothetical protein
VQTTLHLLSEERKKVSILNKEICDLKDMYEEESKNDSILTKELYALRDMLNTNKFNDNFNDNYKPLDNDNENTNGNSLHNNNVVSHNDNQTNQNNNGDKNQSISEKKSNTLHHGLQESHSNGDSDSSCVDDEVPNNSITDGLINDASDYQNDKSNNKASIIDKDCWICKNQKNAMFDTLTSQHLTDIENLNLIIKKKDQEICDLSQQLVVQKDIVAIITNNNMDIMELLKIEKNSILKLNDVLELEKNSKKKILNENLRFSKEIADLNSFSKMAVQDTIQEETEKRVLEQEIPALKKACEDIQFELLNFNRQKIDESGDVIDISLTRISECTDFIDIIPVSSSKPRQHTDTDTDECDLSVVTYDDQNGHDNRNDNDDDTVVMNVVEVISLTSNENIDKCIKRDLQINDSSASSEPHRANEPSTKEGFVSVACDIDLSNEGHIHAPSNAIYANTNDNSGDTHVDNGIATIGHENGDCDEKSAMRINEKNNGSIKSDHGNCNDALISSLQPLKVPKSTNNQVDEETFVDLSEVKDICLPGCLDKNDDSALEALVSISISPTTTPMKSRSIGDMDADVHDVLYTLPRTSVKEIFRDSNMDNRLSRYSESNNTSQKTLPYYSDDDESGGLENEENGMVEIILTSQ